VAKVDEYRAKAEVCRRMAVAAISPQDKATWLKLAAGWLALIHRRNQLPAERLEAMERTANRQEKSEREPWARAGAGGIFRSRPAREPASQVQVVGRAGTHTSSTSGVISRSSFDLRYSNARPSQAALNAISA
jgi:hypothetical protein